MKTVTSSKTQEQMNELGPWQTQFQIEGQSTGGSFHVPADNRLQRQLLEFCALPQRVLELGSMEGGRTLPLARVAGQVLGIEGRRDHLQRARFAAQKLGIGNAAFLELDLENGDLQKLGTFDVIYNVGLLYLLKEPWRVLRQLAEISPAMFLLTHVADPQQELVIRGGYRGAICEERFEDPLGGLHSQSFRPADQQTLERMLVESGWQNNVLFRNEGTALGYWCQRDQSGSSNKTQATLKSGSVSVVVCCHNYGCYLEDCLESLLAQTRRADEILVVDDASTDNTQEIVRHWERFGVRYQRVEHQNVRLARQTGLQQTTGEIICFLDADDMLSPDYLRSGLRQFSAYDVGIVYSDMVRFGDESSTTVMPEKLTIDLMSQRNFIHCAALVRREALEMSGAFDVPSDPRKEHEDWLMWLQVLRQGWKAQKQNAVLHYRRHEKGNSLTKAWSPHSYFDRRGLPHETITLFVPLSGRSGVWPRFQQFLEQQTWPHDQVKLVLMDTSQDARFGRRIRRWISSCDYRDVRYFTESVADAGLADEDRRAEGVGDKVRLATAKIYNRLAREVDGQFVWVIEDDVVPPNDAAEKLLSGFDERTATVAGPYRSRFHEGYVAWKTGHDVITEPGSETEIIEGNGFGCTMFRAEALRDALFTCRQPPFMDFDPAFYERLKSTQMHVKLCWDAECEHLETDPRTIMIWDHWPEAWETIDMADYRSGFLSGRAACEWIVETLNSPEPAAIWGLSDGDTAWWCYDALKKIPGIDQEWLEKLVQTSGLHHTDRAELWPLFDDACRNSPHWLVQQNWDIAERFTQAAFTAHGVTVDADAFSYARSHKQKVSCNSVYQLLKENLWWPLLKNKRLAIVSGHAERFATALMNENLVESSGCDEIAWSIESRFSCPDKSVPKADYWKQLREKLFQSEWDLLLCSAGTLSAVICEAARQHGRMAIDVGSMDRRVLKDSMSPIHPVAEVPPRTNPG